MKFPGSPAGTASHVSQGTSLNVFMFEQKELLGTDLEDGIGAVYWQD
ncbi:hypothetical protein P3W85_05335 [Cupriavidus basilensis]|uniref:Uncharacterized protein n=1 Tax=Cupriavidus basilensis TaxID=68895 RepID=A0ABT6AIE6_9BURK|nr:hypothetical protein [Cupriavidus basilensis]MDF3832369.1 hypothetical protein [Cupriavidus basilensis]